MGHVMPEIVIRSVIEQGITNLRTDDAAFNEIFSTYQKPGIAAIYGQKQINEIRDWFQKVKIPVYLAWVLTPDRIPAFSIHLAGENEDESKASIDDYFGGEDGYSMGAERKVNVFSVMIDIGIHAPRDSDQVLWLYYILNYILFKQKMEMVSLGLQLQTYSASDYNRDSKYVADNIWSRWVRFRCVVQNSWQGEQATSIDDVGVDLDVLPSRKISVSNE